MIVLESIRELGPGWKFVLFPAVLIMGFVLASMLGFLGVIASHKLWEAGIVTGIALDVVKMFWEAYAAALMAAPFFGAFAWGWYGRDWFRQDRGVHG